MTYKCFITAKHQQALLVIMCFSMSSVNPHHSHRDEKHLHHSSNSHHEHQFQNQHHHHHQHHQHNHEHHHNSLASSSSAEDEAEMSLSNFGSSFETINNTHVIAQIGSTAILPCIIVETSSQATVNWIRRSDYKLLTVGLATYSSDERFHVEHTRHRGVWDLRIKSVRKDDEGIYECNLSLHPPESIFIFVSVVEAIAEILGAPDVHIDEGSTLRLECKIKQVTENPSHVFWYHEDKMVNFNFHDGYSVLTKLKGALYHYLYDDDTTSSMPDVDSNNLMNNDGSGNELSSASSVLLVHGVQFKHGGNYTCAPSNVRSTSINVHVLKGDKPAAMKHSNQSTIVDTKSSAHSLESNKLQYCISSLWFVILYYAIITLNFVHFH